MQNMTKFASAIINNSFRQVQKEKKKKQKNKTNKQKQKQKKTTCNYTKKIKSTFLKHSSFSLTNPVDLFKIGIYSKAL